MVAKSKKTKKSAARVKPRAKQRSQPRPARVEPEVVAQSMPVTEAVAVEPVVEQPVAQVEHKPPRLFFAIIFLVAVILIVAILISVNNRSNSLTAWAAKNSNNLRYFIDVCNTDGGDMDVQPEHGQIVFICNLPPEHGPAQRYILTTAKGNDK